VEDAALGETPAALQLSLKLPQARHAALRAALLACPGVKGVDAEPVDADHSKWRIGWDRQEGGEASCDVVLRIVLAHAEVRAVLSMHDAVEARLLAALAPNDPQLRRRA